MAERKIVIKSGRGTWRDRRVELGWLRWAALGVAAVAALWLALAGASRAAARLKLNHALYLALENRPEDARAWLRPLAESGPGASRRAARDFLVELALVEYPAPAAFGAKVDADAPPLLKELAAYLRQQGRYAPTGGRVALVDLEEGLFADGAAPAPKPAAKAPPPLPGDGLNLLAPEAPLLARALPLRRDGRWEELRTLLADNATLWRASPARAAFESMAVRAKYETAHWEGLDELVGNGLRGRVFHADLVGPALHLLRQTGRGDEALLCLWRLARADAGAVERLDLPRFLAGPGVASLGAAPIEAEEAAKALRRWLANPIDPAAAADPRGFLPPLAAANAPNGCAPSTNWAAKASVVPASAGIKVADGEGDRFVFASAGELLFRFDKPLDLGSLRLVVRARGEAAEGEWPVLLLRVNGESRSELLLASAESRDYARTLRLREPLRSLSLTYVNNGVSAGSAEDRNAVVAEVFLGAAGPR